MTSPFGRLVLVVDRDRMTGEATALEDALRARGLAHRRVEVRPGEGIDAASEALSVGDRFLVAMGGDRVVNEVANALLAHEGEPRPVLGVVPSGTGCDFARTFGLPDDPARAAGHLDGDGTFAIDAARVTYRDGRGRDRQRFFVNAAEAGLGAAVLRRTERLPPRLGRGRRFFGFWLAFTAFRPRHVELTGDRRTWSGSANDVIVANGQYLGDGYRWSPKSWPSDGYLDVLVMTGPASDAYTMLPKATLGEHLPSPHVIEYRSRRLVIEAPHPLPVHADGIVLGTTPATFEVLPEALLLKI